MKRKGHEEGPVVGVPGSLGTRGSAHIAEGAEWAHGESAGSRGASSAECVSPAQRAVTARAVSAGGAALASTGGACAGGTG